MHIYPFLKFGEGILPSRYIISIYHSGTIALLPISKWHCDTFL